MTANPPGRLCKQCAGPRSLINGRALRESPSRRSLLKKADDKRWIEICPACERRDLFDSRGIALPFYAPDSVMRTVADTPAENVLAIARFRFTWSALDSGVALANRAQPDSTVPTTDSVECRARRYLAAPSARKATELSKEVCKWGGGERVLGNLEKHHAGRLGAVMHRWMQAALAATSDEDAIAPKSDQRPAGLPHGLGISFGSKHLRMLDPERFAVLDSVLSEGFGYALNPKGYALFMRDLRNFHNELSASGWQHSLARTESGLFSLVRQHVRIDSERGTKKSSLRTLPARTAPIWRSS